MTFADAVVDIPLTVDLQVSVNVRLNDGVDGV